MQKLINVIALLSGLTSLGLIGGGAYLYTQKDALVEGAITKVTEAAVGAVTNALPGMLDAAMPELPEVTGGALPVAPATGNVSGPAIPSF
jgi:hypothetical protein|tara:strand:+ start:410 stop:679 length:270 start_codon:yes stop_codon:yes gene_type:complete